MKPQFAQGERPIVFPATYRFVAWDVDPDTGSKSIVDIAEVQGVASRRELLRIGRRLTSSSDDCVWVLERVDPITEAEAAVIEAKRAASEERVPAYFERKLGKTVDLDGLDVPLSCTCGVACVRIIDAAATFVAAVDPIFGDETAVRRIIKIAADAVQGVVLG